MVCARCCWPLLALGTPAWAADPPALKETLGKVQSDADTKAVEDLIDKLKGVSRKPAPAAPHACGRPVGAGVRARSR